MNIRNIFLVILFLGILAACGTPTSTAEPEATAPSPTITSQLVATAEPVQKANPASEYCIEQGGTLAFEESGSGGQVGVCYFEDNRQCDEWALMRGDCPVGGVKVTGYVTPAARYCAITGGTYNITAASGSDDEQGMCIFKDGSACDVWEYWYATCSPGMAAAPVPTPLMGGGAAILAFDSNRAAPYSDLYTIDITSSEVIRLTHGEANTIAGPWSPDGQQIAYSGYGLTNSYIGVMNADGSDPHPLSQMSGSDEGFPDWSPDGLRIAFTSRRDGNNEIYLMNTDGTNPVRLTDKPGDDFAPSWSPDGTQIAFVSDRDQSPGVYDLYIMSADGSNVRQLTNDPAIDYSPDWSPDGQMITFRSHHDGPGDIYVINVDGSDLRNLTDDPAEDWAPTWSPDGLLIAFQTNREGNWEIYRMAADGSDLVNFTLNAADDQHPYWKP